jgi:chromosome segregation ATPase
MAWELLLSGLFVLSAGVLAGSAWGLFRASRQPPDLQVALQELRAERARDKAELAELAERMMDAGDRIARSRARVETAQQRAEERESRKQQQQQPELPPLEAIKLRARQLGKL